MSRFVQRSLWEELLQAQEGCISAEACLPSVLSINTTSGVIFYSEMDICPLTPVSVYLVYR